MKKNLILCLAFVLLGSAQVSLGQDFDKAVDALMAGDYETALPEMKRLAEQGNSSAQIYLGEMYDKGLGVIQNYEEAVKWYRLAAEQGVG